MLITDPQKFRFFREWKAIVQARGWDHTKAEAERHALIERAGFSSLTEVDPDNGFTNVLKELAAMDDNLGGMLQTAANKRRQKIWKIRQVPTAYWAKIATARFKTSDLASLKDWQIDQLLFTVSDRTVAQHRNETQERRRQTSRTRRAIQLPDARITFPASAIGDPAIGHPDSAISHVQSALEEEANCPF